MSRILTPVLLMLLLTACSSKEDLKRDQYFAEGYQLYMVHCANCHQQDGKGMANLYPTIDGSPRITNSDYLSCLIRNGLKDTLVVNGKKFFRPMPSNTVLTDLEVAEIVTYVKVKWAADSVYASTEQVVKAFKDCQGPVNL